jgi:methionyl-tRNA formyltransferase
VRVAILSSFPRIDRHAYKAYFLDRMLRRSWVEPEDVVLVYGQSRLLDYRKEVTRLGPGQVLRKLPHLLSSRAPDRSDSEPVLATSTALPALARRRGVRVEIFDRLGSPDCLALLRELQPDTIHNLSGAFVPPAVLALAGGPAGVVGGHYGILPRLRGTDTVRWAIYLDLPVMVSHMALAPELDMGDILSVRRVPVRRGDRFADIYRKCQFAVADGHIDVLEAVRDGTLRRTPQHRVEGSLFQRMGPYMRGKVDTKLAREEYAHYE